MKLTLTIPKPCHEDWNAMQARQTGRFCDSCQHTVADLTRATDAQLVALFSGDTRPKCARFDPAQLDRALGAAELQRQASAFPLAAFTSLLAVAAGHEALAQQGAPFPRLTGEVAITRPASPPPAIKGRMLMTSTDDDTSKKCGPFMGDTIVVREADVPQPLVSGQAVIAMDGIIAPPRPVIHEEDPPNADPGRVATIPPVEVCGSVVDETGAPAPFIAVSLEEDPGVSTTTDTDGAFRILIPADLRGAPVSIRIVALGYHPLFRSFTLEDDPLLPTPVAGPGDIPRSGATDAKDPPAITGFVEDVTTGHMLPNAVVGLKGTQVRVRCDEKGSFALRIPEGSNRRPLELEIIVNGTDHMTLPLSAGAVPCCVPIKFRADGTTNPATISPACHDLGTIRMQERRYLTGIVAVAPAPKATTMGRMTAPLKRSLQRLTR